MFAKRIITLITTALLASSISGCVNPLDTAKFESALASLKESPLEGFKLSDTRKPTCGIDYCEPNPGYTFTNQGTPDSLPVFCQKLIDWVTKNGADSWIAGEDFIAMPLEGHQGAAQVACVGGITSFVGSTNDIRWWVVGNPTSYEISTVMNRDGKTVNDDRMLPHTWEEARGLLMDGTRLTMDLLSAIETYRIKNPDADPSSVKTIEEAIKGIELDPATKIITDKNGKAHYLNLPADDIFLERCLNIKPFDQEFFGVISPGEGFLPMWITPEEEPQDQFGYSTSGACHER